jgi:hypothetical protein
VEERGNSVVSLDELLDVLKGGEESVGGSAGGRRRRENLFEEVEEIGGVNELKLVDEPETGEVGGGVGEGGFGEGEVFGDE